ncbi:MAG: Gfo/Idh/MocA family oxidoreductase [Lentisphaeria bacterium]|nr:Gfo/Idh/MocA family oxidoreductase [Lentisphaeria bacterium]
MKKFGLIGAGGYAATYVRYLLPKKESGKIDFCGVVIRHPDKIPETVEKFHKAGVRIYPDKESMYAENRLDVVAIPSGIGSHCQLTVDALERGYNVIVEKPAAGSLAEVDRMIEAEKRTGKFVTVGFQHIHAPDIRKLKQILIDGKFGRIRRITAMGRWPRADKYYQRNNWVCKLRGANGEFIYDSPINNAFAHYLNLCLFLAGDEFEKSAHAAEMQAELYRARRSIETFDTCGVRLKTSSGAEAVCLFTHACSDRLDPVLRIDCDNAVVAWSEKNSWSAKLSDGNVIGSGCEPTAGHAEMFDMLVARAEGGNPFMCTLQIAREQTFVIEKMHRHFGITKIPESDFTVNPEDGQHAVAHIAGIFDQGFTQSKLPSELAVPWAASTESVIL